MKQVLKKILPDRLYSGLSSTKRQALALTDQLAAAGFRMVPRRFQLAMKGVEVLGRMDYEKHPILLSIDSQVEYQARLNSCKKEPETVEWIETFFKENDVFYDIGANVGAYSLVAAKHLKGKGQIYAFEPGFPSFAKLCRNVLINRCSGIVMPLQIALSDKTRLDTFNYSSLVPGSALHALGKSVGYDEEYFEPVFKQPMLAFCVDDLIQQFGLPIPNHMKLDVDGIELNILHGASKTLDNRLLRSLIVEVEEHGSRSSKIVDYLAGKGFPLHSKHQYMYGGPASQHAGVFNYIFRR